MVYFLWRADRGKVLLTYEARAEAVLGERPRHERPPAPQRVEACFTSTVGREVAVPFHASVIKARRWRSPVDVLTIKPFDLCVFNFSQLVGWMAIWNSVIRRSDISRPDPRAEALCIHTDARHPLLPPAFLPWVHRVPDLRGNGRFSWIRYALYAVVCNGAPLMWASRNLKRCSLCEKCILRNKECPWPQWNLLKEDKNLWRVLRGELSLPTEWAFHISTNSYLISFWMFINTGTNMYTVWDITYAHTQCSP